MARFYFDNSDEGFRLGGTSGATSDRDVSGLNAEGYDEHRVDNADEQRRGIGAERNANLETGGNARPEGEPSWGVEGEQGIVLGHEQNAQPDALLCKIPIGRPHSPKYVEYSARYDFKWPEEPHRVGVENEYPASKIVSVIDVDMLGQLY